MSARPMDSLSIATDRLKFAMEEFRAALAAILDSNATELAEGNSDDAGEMEAES